MKTAKALNLTVPPIAAGKRRRGDRIGPILLRRSLSGNGPKLTRRSATAAAAFGGKADTEWTGVECAPSGGHLAGLELTRTAGLSEDESHGQTPFP